MIKLYNHSSISRDYKVRISCMVHFKTNTIFQYFKRERNAIRYETACQCSYPNNFQTICSIIIPEIGNTEFTPTFSKDYKYHIL